MVQINFILCLTYPPSFSYECPTVFFIAIQLYAGTLWWKGVIMNEKPDNGWVAFNLGHSAKRAAKFY